MPTHEEQLRREQPHPRIRIRERLREPREVELHYVVGQEPNPGSQARKSGSITIIVGQASLLPN